MLGGLLDDPELIAAAARDAGLDPAQLEEWCTHDDVLRALQADVEAARSPTPAARALDHKLGGPKERRRYTAPSYEMARADSAATPVVIPGFNPIEAYETAIANLAPELPRRPKPARVEDVLAWAGEPLATAEVALVMQLDPQKARAALTRVATPHTAGADFYCQHMVIDESNAYFTGGVYLEIVPDERLVFSWGATRPAGASP